MVCGQTLSVFHRCGANRVSPGVSGSIVVAGGVGIDDWGVSDGRSLSIDRGWTGQGGQVDRDRLDGV